MKEKLLNNWVLKICSVLGAILIWLLAVNASDPVTETTVKNVKVKILNEEAVTGSNLAYDIVKGKTVDFILQGPKSEVSKIRSEDCSAVVDFKQLAKDPSLDDTALRNVLISYNTSFSGGVRVSRISTEVMQIRLEEIKSKEFVIMPRYNAGDLQEGYSMDEVLVTPEKVTISGRASLLDNISSAGVELDVEDLTDNAQVEAPIYFYNAGDNRISLEEGDLISISATVAGVSMSVQKIKELTLDYKVSSEPEDGYRCSEIINTPQSLRVKGSQAVLSKLSTITIPPEVLDITGARESKDFEVDITPYLPVGTELVDPSENMVKFHIEIEPVRSRTLQIDADQVRLNGGRLNFRYELISGRILVEVSGLQVDLDQIDTGKLVLTADIGDLEDGVHDVAVSVQLPEGLKLENEPKLKLRVVDPTKPTEPSETETESNSSETPSTAPAASETEPEETSSSVHTNPA